MNGYEMPNLIQALEVLNELLDLTTTYDLTYARDPEYAQDILTNLKAKVQSHSLSTVTSTRSYTCIQSLSLRPLLLLSLQLVSQSISLYQFWQST